MNTPTNAVASGPNLVLRTPYQVYYSTEKPLPISDVISALQGLDGLLKALPTALEKLTGVAIDDCQFFVQRIESGSLLESVVVRLGFGNEEALNKFLDKVRHNIVEKHPIATTIALVITALAFYGLYQATQQNAPNITIAHNTIVTAGAQEFAVSSKEFEAAIRDAASNKKAIAESALRFVKPAKADPAAAVAISTGEGEPLFSLTPEAIAEVPERLNLGSNERFEELVNTELKIRATNLDSRTSGWAARIAQREERLPMELAPDVNPADVYGRVDVRADVLLIYKEGRRGEIKPAKIYVEKVHKATTDSSHP